MKKFCSAVALSMLASSAYADSVGGCGLGSKLFDGQKGIAPQVLAVTTNGTLGNQTFGITFGTLGCSQDGVVKSNWKTALFIDGNRLALSRDAAAGQGESLDSLMSIMNVKAEDRAHFASVLKQNFSAVFADEQVGRNMKAVLSADSRLTGYASAI